MQRRGREARLPLQVGWAWLQENDRKGDSDHHADSHCKDGGNHAELCARGTRGDGPQIALDLQRDIGSLLHGGLVVGQRGKKKAMFSQAGRQGAGMGAQRSARAASTPRPRVRARGRGRTYGHLVFVQLS